MAENGWRSLPQRSERTHATAAERRWLVTGVGLVLGLLSGVCVAKPVMAAVAVKISLGALELSLSLEALQTYVLNLIRYYPSTRLRIDANHLTGIVGSDVNPVEFIDRPVDIT